MDLSLNVNFNPNGVNTNVAGTFGPYESAIGVAFQAEKGKGYIADGGPGLQTFTLPPIVASGGNGDGFAIKGNDLALFKIAQNSGQFITGQGWLTTTGAGGSLSSTSATDFIVLVAVDDTRTQWSPTTIQGFFDLNETGALVNGDGVKPEPVKLTQTIAPMFFTRRIEDNFNTTQLSSLPTVPRAYRGAIYYRPKGLIFLIPENADNVGIIDIVNKTFDNTSIPAGGGIDKYTGALTAWNGKAYLMPRNANDVGILDMENFTLDRATITGIGGTNRYFGGFIAPNNGMIYSPAFLGSTILKVNPFNNTFSTIPIGLAGGQLFMGAILSSYNGMGYCVPRSGSSVVAIVNPFNDTVDIASLTGFVGTNKWASGCEGSDQKLYFTSNQSNATLIVDPATNTADDTTITGFPGHESAVLAANNKIYCPPKDADSVLIIDVATQTADVTTIPLPGPGDRKSGGIVFTDTGDMYTVPREYDFSIIIQTGIPKISVDWCVSAYGNTW